MLLIPGVFLTLFKENTIFSPMPTLLLQYTFLWVDNRLLGSVSGSIYDPIVLLDHASVSIECLF